MNPSRSSGTTSPVSPSVWVQTSGTCTPHLYDSYSTAKFSKRVCGHTGTQLGCPKDWGDIPPMLRKPFRELCMSMVLLAKLHSNHRSCFSNSRYDIEYLLSHCLSHSLMFIRSRASPYPKQAPLCKYFKNLGVWISLKRAHSHFQMPARERIKVLTNFWG